MSYLFGISLLVFVGFNQSVAQNVIPGHSHNDYLHKRPLHQALNAGLTSVEADVHLMKGDLYVAHVRPLGKNEKRSLENLYLKPLFDHVKKNNGKVYPDYEGPFYLMIDFKGGGEELFNQLIEVLEKYRSMLTIIENGNLKQGAVTVFLSGGRPTAAVLNAEPKLAFLDGRPSDIGKQIPAEFMPVISDSYRGQLKWNGRGQIPDSEKQKLKALVDRVHSEGKKLRLWASPDFPNAWQSFQELGVDLINTDSPSKFAEFMNGKR